MTKKSKMQEKILEEAEKIVMTSGAIHLTLDNIAKKAKISKGGLLYHFPNKEQLLKAMINNFVSKEIQEREKAMAELKDKERTFLLTHLLAWKKSDTKKLKLASSLIAAVAHNPDFTLPAKEKYKEVIHKMKAESKEPLEAILLFLANEGLWLAEIVGISPFNQEEKKEILEYIEKKALSQI